MLWVPAGLATYWLNGAFATHAFEGLMVPLAVLLVRGAARVRLPAALAWLCVLALTVPGLAYDARKFVRTSRSGLVQYALPRGRLAALRWVIDQAPAGRRARPHPVCRRRPLPDRPCGLGRPRRLEPGLPGPGAAGRPAVRRAACATRPPSAAFVRATGARLLVADCDHASGEAALTRALGPLIAEVRRFGCARVYVLREALNDR